MISVMILMIMLSTEMHKLRPIAKRQYIDAAAVIEACEEALVDGVQVK